MGFTPDLMITHRVVVGISDMAVANNVNVTLTTFALGSCVGILGFDSHSRAAGMIHIMLPAVGRRRESDYSPCMFVDTGLPLLLKELAGFRALRSRMVFALVGGASLRLPDANRTFFRIGEDNIAAARGFFKEQNLKLVFEDVGGYVNRTMHFHIGNGLLSIKKPSGTSEVQFG